MALSKKSGMFSSRNQGVPRWPTYTWLAKLLMRDRVTSVRVPLLAWKLFFLELIESSQGPMS